MLTLTCHQALSALDRLEVRGRDSAGLHVLIRDHALDPADPGVRAAIDRSQSTGPEDVTVDLAGLSDVHLMFRHADFYDEEHGGSDWAELRTETVRLLQRDRELREIAGLVGVDALEIVRYFRIALVKGNRIANIQDITWAYTFRQEQIINLIT